MYDPRKNPNNCELTYNQEYIFVKIWTDFCKKPADIKGKAYVNMSKVKNLNNLSYLKSITWSFFKKECLNLFLWDKIHKEYSENINKVEERNIKKEVKKELRQLYLYFPKGVLKKKLNALTDKNFFDNVSEIKYTKTKLKSYDDLCNQDFKYFDVKKLIAKGTKNRNKYHNKESFIIATKSIEEISLKSEYKKITYLEYHAKNNNQQLFQNKFNHADLKKFVSEEFDFYLFLNNIVKSLHSILETHADYNSQQMYQLTCKNIYSLIGDANKDLQQVSYRLSFDFIGHVFLFGLCVIWRFFEQKDWKNHEQVLNNLKKDENRLKDFFIKQTSSDCLSRHSISRNHGNSKK